MTTKQWNHYYGSSEHFKLTNPNPVWATKKGMKWDRCDCVIRALANSTGITWLEAFDFLTAKARAEFNVPNDGCGFRRWVVEAGAVWTYCKAEKGKKRMTALQFAETHPQGRFIIDIAHHEAACVDGVILDTWNCGDKCVVGYYDMSNFSI